MELANTIKHSERRNELFLLFFTATITILAYFLSKNQEFLKHLFILNPLIHGNGWHFTGNFLLLFILLSFIEHDTKFYYQFGFAYILSVLYDIICFLITGIYGVGLSMIICYLYAYYAIENLKKNFLKFMILSSITGVLFIQSVMKLNTWNWGGNLSHITGILFGILIYSVERKYFKEVKL